MNMSKRLIQPRQAYERYRTKKKSAKIHIHEMLREDPALTVEQLAKASASTRAYARIWKKNFFAAGHEIDDKDLSL